MIVTLSLTLYFLFFFMNSNKQQSEIESQQEIATNVESIKLSKQADMSTNVQTLIDIKDGYKLKTTARTIPGLITAIIKHEEQFYLDERKREE